MWDYIRPKTKRMYISNKEFFEEICLFLKKRKKNKNYQIPDSIIHKFIALAHNFSLKPCYYSYTYKDEMKSEAIFTCIRYIEKFNPEKSNNPFSYFTQVVQNAFRLVLNKEENISNIKHKLIENHMHEMNLSNHINCNDDNHDDNQI